jgi:hypothetical protein
MLVVMPITDYGSAGADHDGAERNDTAKMMREHHQYRGENQRNQNGAGQGAAGYAQTRLQPTRPCALIGKPVVDGQRGGDFEGVHAMDCRSVWWGAEAEENE